MKPAMKPDERDLLIADMLAALEAVAAVRRWDEMNDPLELVYAAIDKAKSTRGGDEPVSK